MLFAKSLIYEQKLHKKQVSHLTNNYKRKGSKKVEKIKYISLREGQNSRYFR